MPSGVKVLRSNLLPLSVGIVALVLIIIGIILISNSPAVNEDISFVYTDCTTLLDNVPCKDKQKNSDQDCDCFFPFELDHDKNGSVTLFYELDSFDTASDDYKQSNALLNLTSLELTGLESMPFKESMNTSKDTDSNRLLNSSVLKDDKQLRGELSQSPSPSCGKYATAKVDGIEKPIAPCGAIADSMFNDTFYLSNPMKKLEVPRTQIGLNGITEEDRKLFHNPPGNLEEAFKNYTKPINWQKNIWEKNEWQVNNDANHQGLQNEAFIAWMKTDMKMKPAWRVNHTEEFQYGLPAGNYTLTISYMYPFSRYSGERKAILRFHMSDANVGLLSAGIVLIILAIGTVVGLLVYNKVKHGKYCYYDKVKDMN